MESFTVQGLSLLLAKVLPEPHAGLLSGLLFGTKATLTPQFRQALVSSGTIHIIALSGMNISILIDMLSEYLLRGISRRWATLLLLGAIVWFVWFVGPSPSIVRAAIMGSMSLVAISTGRQRWAVWSLVVAVGVMLVINISWIADLSFQLSALATLGILLFGNRRKPAITVQSDHEERWYERIVRHFWHILETDLRLTLAAQSLTIPLILFTFRRISLVAPLTNIAIGWLIAPLTALGWVTAITGFLVPPISYMFGWVDWVFLEYLIRTVHFMSELPLANIEF
jgi:competence protein ComEC